MAGFEPMPDTGQRIDHRWELVIERESGTSKKSHSVQVSRQDQMAMIEIGEHGWFGLDLDSGDGAGFVDKRDSEDTLHIYFSALTDVIKPWLQDRRREAAANG
jgi:hypothetical protein